MTSIEEFALTKLGALETRHLRRELTILPDRVVNFCSNDYLGLAHDSRLKTAAREAISRTGTGAGSSRLVTGNHRYYEILETQLAKLKQTDGALVFGSGYLANIGTIPAIVSDGDVIFADELCHSCMISGARLSRAEVHFFPHNDVETLRDQLAKLRRRFRHCLVLTEGVFSMDGDLSPLKNLCTLTRSHEAWLMVDDAHGVGVVGGGRGSSAHWSVTPDIQLGTLSKSVGAYGGYVAAARPVIELLINRARSMVFSTGLPPAIVAAASAGVDIIAREPELCSRPVALARRFCNLLGLSEPASAIVPLIVGDSSLAMTLSSRLAEFGYWVKAIRPPTVPDGTARLRFTFCADHTEVQVENLADCVAREILPRLETRP